jgi:endonuclease/exonuclease/phosphatase family metal-dependent hydrolase
MRYANLKTAFTKTSERARVAHNLIQLRAALAHDIPAQQTDANLLVGTWNIRNFDDNRFGHGPRLEESYYYLAEIISAFDVIAIQEVCEDLAPLKKLMYLLGPEYDFMFTDVTEGTGGNGERLGFIFHSAKVQFKGIAGEIVLPPNMLISEETNRMQFCRTPFSVEFQRSWFKFNFATVHIYYGASSKKSEEYIHRVAEIDAVAKFLSRRADREAKQHGVNYLLVGDFNIDALGDDAFNALEKHGFTAFQNRKGSNRHQTKYYDQISFKSRPGEMVPSKAPDGRQAWGVFNPFDTVFSDDKFSEHDVQVKATLRGQKADLEEQLTRTGSASKIKTLNNKIAKVDLKLGDTDERREYYAGEWRTFQISDHLPLWVDLNVDFTEQYLERISSE